MKHALQALVWEQVWKNRVVFPVLALLLVAGVGLTQMLAGVDRGTWWVRTVERTLLTAFFASVLLSFAPFTLMESQEGWRMNSMVTRWFVLPVRTGVLVLIPFVAACALVGCLVGAWMILFRRLFPDLDFTHVFLVLLLGVAVMQTLAWILPRKPSQFWPTLALWFPIMMLLAVLPLDGASWQAERQFMRRAVPVAIPLLGLLAYTAARLNHCGAWPGEVPLNRLGTRLLHGRPVMPMVKSPAAALFWSDVAPLGRTFLITWTTLLLLLVGMQVLRFVTRSNSPQVSLSLVLHITAMVVPPLGVFWLAASGLFLGSEPGTGFRTSLSPFSSVRPVSAGTLASQRVLAALGLWLMVWLPWLLLLEVHTHLHPRWAGVDLPGIYATSGRLMALSAHGLIGALPLFLWGRVEGFPNMLLAGIVAWAGTWGMASYLSPPEGGSPPWIPVLALLLVKWGAGFSALVCGLRAGHCTWRYATGLAGGWLGIVSLLVWMLPTWNQQQWWGLAIVALFVPFTRLALAPLALAANRHR